MERGARVKWLMEGVGARSGGERAATQTKQLNCAHECCKPKYRRQWEEPTALFNGRGHRVCDGLAQCVKSLKISDRTLLSGQQEQRRAAAYLGQHGVSGPRACVVP
eukprot:1159684-Pelagomonas_calceolata.AAC.2